MPEKARVLLADRHSIVREGMALVLEASQMVKVVGTAADGGQAVRMARELRPHVVVLSMDVPGGGALQAARAIRQTAPGTNVLILSSHGDAEDLHRALQAGARGYLTRGAAGREILRAIRVLQAGRSYLRTASGGAVAGSPAEAADHGDGPLQRLSARERQVMSLLVDGLTGREIASLLRLSPKSVDTYRGRLLGKLGLRNLAELVTFAVRHGLTGPA